MFTFTTLIQHSTGSQATEIRQKDIKEIHTGKEEVKLLLFVVDNTVYREP